MINLNSVNEPSKHIQDRARHMWAVRYDIGQHTISYRVTPWGKKHAHLTKDRRIVLFDLKRRTADCLSMETGEVCEANSYGRLCSHVYKAAQVMESANKRLGRAA